MKNVFIHFNCIFLYFDFSTYVFVDFLGDDSFWQGKAGALYKSNNNQNLHPTPKQKPRKKQQNQKTIATKGKTNKQTDKQRTKQQLQTI